jgi:hypothetical protein
MAAYKLNFNHFKIIVKFQILPMLLHLKTILFEQFKI